MHAMELVAGVDVSTQSCKVTVRRAADGRTIRHGQATHPTGTEVHPDAWLRAFRIAEAQAGGLDDVSAVSLAGQQHGLVALDRHGEVIRPAILWNDRRTLPAVASLLADMSAADWTSAVGTAPVTSLTVAMLRWLADHEPDSARRIAAVALPHDWVSWRLSGSTSLEDLTTDRSEASGTGYFDPSTDSYRRDLLALALRRSSADDIVLPRVLGPAEPGLRADPSVARRAVLAPGAGDNASAALAIGLGPGDVMLSMGTSGVVSAVTDRPLHDPTGLVAGFADATGAFLPLTAMLNCAQVFAYTAELLGTELGEFGELALEAPPGASGLTLLPFLIGERTPHFPDATGSLTGLTPASFTRANLARAAVEGVLCGLRYGLEAMTAVGIPVRRILLVGGGARSVAVQRIAPAVLGRAIELPEPAEYVAMGAAKQAAWMLSGAGAPPSWPQPRSTVQSAAPTPEVWHTYRRRSGLEA